MKHILLTSVLLISVIFCGGIAKAQQLKQCGSTQALLELFKENPQLENDINTLMESNKKFVKSGSEATVIYTIPIVFHILHQYGGENVSDANVYDQMRILNEDFRKLNTDISVVVPEFQSIIADCMIEFRLATKDPNGNCTNGIEHIYTHETLNGDDNSKFNQWPRSKYLNVWVSSTLRPGVAGYSFHPASTAGQGYFRDGVMMLTDYLGSLAPSSANNSRTLTHEIGHYLSLAHPWGNTNEPGVECGDDGIDDTPITKGWSTCPMPNYNPAAAVCSTGVIENFQNFMEYSYCDFMFTNGQATAMQATLNNATAYRDNLWTAANLAETGANAVVPPYTDANIGALCSPVSDFTSNRKYVCLNGSITYTNKSWRAMPTSYSWSFEDGVPASASTASVDVTYNTPGWKKVTLTAANAIGSDTKIEESYIFVSNSYADFPSGRSEDFESGTANWWISDNPENSEAKWKLTEEASYSGTHSFVLNNYPANSSNNYFGTLGGSKDILISPSYDLRYMKTQDATLSFRYSCATRAEILDNITEKFQIFSSSDCGVSWTSLKIINKSELTNAGNSGTYFIPNSQLLWKTVTIPLTATQVKPHVRFKFEYTASDYSNNMYLDDININGSNVGTGEITPDYFSFTVFPNPAGEESNLNISYYNHGTKMKVTVFDVLGREVFVSNENNSTGEKSIVLNKKDNGLHSGIYFITLFDGTNSQTRKAVIE